MTRTSVVQREATLAAGAAASLAAVLVWLGPPGPTWRRTRTSARSSSTTASRSGTTSGTRAATASSPTASSTTRSRRCSGSGCSPSRPSRRRRSPSRSSSARQWGPTARWSSRTFAVVWAGIVFSAAFPFALGAALALLAIWALQARRSWRFAVLAALTLAASPLAFLLLTLAARRVRDRALAGPAHAARARADDRRASACSRSLLWRAFPASGQLPVLVAGAAGRADLLRARRGAVVAASSARGPLCVDVRRLPASPCLAAFAIPSAVGENVARLRYAAIPLAVLTLSLRRWRPLPVALGRARARRLVERDAARLFSYVHARGDPASHARLLDAGDRASCARTSRPRTASRSSTRPATGPPSTCAEAQHPARARLASGRTTSRRTRCSTTTSLGRRPTARWLRGLGVRYVVLTSAPTDYSARAEAALLRSGRSGLWRVLRTPQLTIFEVPRRTPDPDRAAPGRGSSR